ncbi:conserved unknown protein [Ectocarpus siliculosus]|uniref:Uncharacterized protein n=1 Tax=Ectocarpus siliculosus TaxID=2880 RepID=D7FZ23_ECTSI|nr:conserved unknown protein [Ectocarpus siliculosus]|eukprot:CBJ32640.1 conserved unknown protein [Ectocarpus siliculosus]
MDGHLTDSEQDHGYSHERYQQQHQHQVQGHPRSSWVDQGGVNGGRANGYGWADRDDASAQWSRAGRGEGKGFEESWKVDGEGGEGRPWKHEDLKQLLQDLEDTEIAGAGGAKRGRGRRRYRPPPPPRPGARGGEGGLPGETDETDETEDGVPRSRPGAGWGTPPNQGGQRDGEGDGVVERRDQTSSTGSEPRTTAQGGGGGGGEEDGGGRGRDQGLTLGPPPRFPGTGAGSAGNAASGEPDASLTPGSGSPSQSDQGSAPPQFAKRRVRVTWEAEGWGEGEQNAAQLDSDVTDAGQATSFRSNDQYDDNYYYGSVADTHAAESQQHYHEGLVGSLLQSGDFSDTGSAGTWTDADTEEFVVGHNHGRLEHLTAYGYHQRYSHAMVGSRVGGRVPGRRLVMPPGAPIGRTGSSAPLGASTPVLDLDYSAKVLDYGRRDGTGPPKTLTLRSWSRIMGAAGIATAGAFLAVSPNNAPRDLYLALFRRNLGLIAASLVGPAVYSFLLYDGSKANINTYVRVVTFAFTWGYLISFALEIVAATSFQLCVLAVMEPKAFDLTPHVPAIFLPWVLRPFRGRAATATAASDAAKAARTAAEAAEAAQEPTHVHTYLLYVLGSAMGLKAACTMQRVLVYTREYHEHKTFFAIARGFFPLFELCGSIMAMNLARRDILGDRMNRLQLFFVPVSLNAYAVFRLSDLSLRQHAYLPGFELLFFSSRVISMAGIGCSCQE